MEISQFSKPTITLPWIEKYRPHILNDVLSSENIRECFKNYVKNRYLPHLLLYGPPGTGKTSTIYACAKELYGIYFEHYVLEINASEDRGIESVRNKIKDFAMTSSMFNYKMNIFKLIILDEVDSMTPEAQAMLKRLIEDATNNTRFCFICNKIKHIDPAIQSRCTSFRFPQLSKDIITTRIKQIAKIQNITVKNSGIHAIIKISKGDMRKVLNILQATNMAYDIIDSNNVMSCIGYPSHDNINKIYNAIIDASYNFKSSYDLILQIKNNNCYAIADIITELHTFIMKNIDNYDIKYIMNVINNLGKIELNLIHAPSDNIQIASIISAFII